MASVKATFTLDEESVRKLALEAQRTGKPKSAVVREAINEYSERSDRLSAVEQRRMLAALDKFAATLPTRPQAEVDAEIAEIRAARRSGGRLTRSD